MYGKVRNPNPATWQKRVLVSMALLHKKWCLPLRISSVNLTKSALVKFTEKILNGKFHFLFSDFKKFSDIL